MNSQTNEKHHHHHEPGKHRHRKRSSKTSNSLDQSQQQPSQESQPQIQQSQTPNTTYESMRTFDNQSFSTKDFSIEKPIQNDIEYTKEYYRSLYDKHTFTLSELKDLATDNFCDRILAQIDYEKKKFIKSIQSYIPEYVNTVEKKIKSNSPFDHRSSGYLDNHFDNNYLSDDYRNFDNESKDDLRTSEYNYNANPSIQNLSREDKNDSNTGSDIFNLLKKSDSEPITHDDEENVTKSNDNISNDITNNDITNNDNTNNDEFMMKSSNDDTENKNNESVDLSRSNSQKKRKRRSQKNSQNEIDSSPKVDDPKVDDHEPTNSLQKDSTESGEIPQPFDADSLDDSQNLGLNRLENAKRVNSEIIEEESVDDDDEFSLQLPSNKGSKKPLNSSKKFNLFDYTNNFSANELDFNDVI